MLAVILLAVVAFMFLSIAFEVTGRLHRQNQAMGREIRARAATLDYAPGKPAAAP